MTIRELRAELNAEWEKPKYIRKVVNFYVTYPKEGSRDYGKIKRLQAEIKNLQDTGYTIAELRNLVVTGKID